MKIEWTMKVKAVGASNRSVDGQTFSDVVLDNGLEVISIKNVSEYAARSLAGEMFGRVRITIESAED